MDRTRVTSSNVVSVGWNSATSVLEVEFHHDRLYQYEGVPESVYRGLLNATSHGEYHHQNIEDRYPHRRLH
jgi:hypothetical protein